MKFHKLAILSISILFFILAFGYIKADVLSINSGGTTNISINPNSFTEGFFSQPSSPTVSNQTNQTNQSGGGPSGTGVTPPSTVSISVSPAMFNLNMLINSNLQEVISVANSGSGYATLNISETGLDNMIILENNSISIAPGQVQNFNVIFVAPNATGIYNGSIIVGNVVIPVSLNVQTKLLLFDSNIVVLNKNYQVLRGTPLQTQVTLIPMGVNVRTDVTLDYSIKDYNGTVYLTRSETLLVTNETSIKRNFDTGSLPIGNYTVNLQLIYSNGIAPSSAAFQVVSTVSSSVGLLVYYLIVAIFVIFALIIILIIVRRVIKYRKAQPVSSY